MLWAGAFLILGLPLLGAWSIGLPLARYLEFPPRTVYVEHPGFSWPVAAGIAALVTVSVGVWLAFPAGPRPDEAPPVRPASRRPFPWFGYLGLGVGLVSWLLAWTRFPWFAPAQPHVFTPLWVSYILVVNALTFRRAGRCMLLDDARYFRALVPVSAVVWWSFEYLNRFVQNWHYLGVHLFGPFEYLIGATLPFATVLPAVLGTTELISTFHEPLMRFRNRAPLLPAHPRLLAGVVLGLSSLSLALVPVFPNILFPLLWVSPLLVGVSLQTLRGRRHLFSEVAEGDWTRFTSAALGALICGFFWEMWNLQCLAKWIYTVPYVNCWHVFEMPLLGYAGYLPFGLECLFVGDVVREALRSTHDPER